MTEEGGIKIHQIRRALCFSVKSQIEEQTLQATWSLSQPLTPALEHTGRRRWAHAARTQMRQPRFGESLFIYKIWQWDTFGLWAVA